MIKVKSDKQKNNVSHGNKKYMVRLMLYFIKQDKVTFYKRARKLGYSLLEDKALTPEERAKVISGLMMIETRNKNYVKVRALGDIPVDEEYKYLVESQTSAAYYQELQEKNLLREQLYKDEIDCEEMKELTEKNCNTLLGCLFIAEMCKHLNLEQLGMQCLNGYKNNNDTNQQEEKTITQAMELLKQKKIMAIPREKWNRVYRILLEEKELENNEDEER